MYFRLYALSDDGGGLKNTTTENNRKGPGTTQRIMIAENTNVLVKSLAAGAEALPTLVGLRKMTAPVCRLGDLYCGTDPFFVPEAPGFWLEEARAQQGTGVALLFSLCTSPAVLGVSTQSGEQLDAPVALPIDQAGPDSPPVGYTSGLSGLVFFRAGQYWVWRDSQSIDWKVGATKNGELLFEHP